MAKLFVNSGDPDQTPHSAASDLGLHCLPGTLLRVSQLQWVNYCTAMILMMCAITLQALMSLEYYYQSICKYTMAVSLRLVNCGLWAFCFIHLLFHFQKERT